MNSKNKYEEDLINLQNKVINLALVSFSLMVVFAESMAILRALTYGMNLTFFIQSLDALALIIITIFRKKLSINQKILAILIIVSIVLITGLYSFGFLASAKYYVAIVPVFISFIVSYRKSVISLIVMLACYVLFGLLYHFGILRLTFDANNYISNPIPWMIDISIILFISL